MDALPSPDAPPEPKRVAQQLAFNSAIVNPTPEGAREGGGPVVNYVAKLRAGRAPGFVRQVEHPIRAGAAAAVVAPMVPLVLLRKEFQEITVHSRTCVFHYTCCSEWRISPAPRSGAGFKGRRRGNSLP